MNVCQVASASLIVFEWTLMMVANVCGTKQTLWLCKLLRPCQPCASQNWPRLGAKFTRVTFKRRQWKTSP